MRRSIIYLAAALCCAAGPAGATSCPQLEIAVVDAAGGRTIQSPDGKPLRLVVHALLTTSDFAGATVSLTEGQIVLNLTLSPEGGARMRAFSQDHVGAEMAFIVDDKLIKLARIHPG